MRDWTAAERNSLTSEAAKAAASFLKGVGDPERDAAVVAARVALEQVAKELQSAEDASSRGDRAVVEARVQLQAALGSGKSTSKSWATITEAERAAAEARVRLELTKQAADQATSALVAARQAAIEAVLPAAAQAVRDAREAERAAELNWLMAQRALGQVRSRAGSLASQADHLRSAAAGGAR